METTQKINGPPLSFAWFIWGLGALLFALSIGLIGAVTAGLPLAAYEKGFLPMMGWVVLSMVLLFFTQETHCRQGKP